VETREDEAETVPGASQAGASGWRQGAPAAALVVLAPVISEVLFGATRVSVLFALVPQIAIWGCGTLVIRYAVRRGRRGWASLLLLGLALAVAEECIIQQTSLAPLVGLAGDGYGRVWGVNWVYFLWALGFESVWVVVLPVQLTELIFRNRRAELWVGRCGLVIASVAWVLGSFVAWYTWTQVARTEVFHMPEFQPPLLYLAAAGAAIVFLAAAAFGLVRRERRHPGAALGHSGANRPEHGRSAPLPWLAGVVSFVLGTPWCALVLLGFGAVPSLPYGIPLFLGATWGLLAFVVMKRWTSSPGWTDLHRFSVVFGGVLACMAAGFVVFAVGGALLIDWVGKAVLNLIAVALLATLGHRLRSERPPDIQEES
jgi:hypothetical protein